MSENSTENSDIKIIVIGKSGKGKTSFVNKGTKNIFSENYKATIVSEYGYKIFEYNEKFYRIQLWDIAGQDRNVKLTKTFAKNALGCIIVCDATNLETRKE
jgi:small GTP-binding protein